jgi:RNA polymerase sigma-54 factor
MSLGQSLHQKQLLKLLPQQIMLMKLLQVPTANLEERIKEELEENPALELSDEDSVDDISTDLKDEFDTSDEEEFDLDGSEDEYDNLDISEYITESDDDIADYKTKDENYPEQDENKVIPIKTEASFFEIIYDQLSMLNLEGHKFKIAEQIVGSLDDDGYLRRETSSIVDDLSFRQSIITTEKEVEKIIKLIQQFEPVGIAARNLQECLLLQLYKKQEERTEDVALAINIISKFFDEFIKKHYEKIKKNLELPEEALKKVIQQIIKLNPRPGENLSNLNKNDTYITPDFFVVNNNGILELVVNSKNAPDLRISEGFKDMMKDYDRGDKKDNRQKEAVMFIKQKIEGAKWFIEMIKQRHQTLSNTMMQIINHQKNFFLTGDATEMKPMILKDIAEKTHLDISTISRVANSKFVQTEFGTFKLKYFFSESLPTDSGEDVSTTEVKKILSNIIEAEDKKKPIADEVLTEMLNEKGYNIARRTVSKYREQLNIPVARLRRTI